MSGLESWLKQATRCLSSESTAQVRSEIQEHYESAHDAAMNGGALAREADRAALAALGDAKIANRQYRRVLLTSAEARALRTSNWEAKVACSRGWLKRALLAMALAFLAAAAALFFAGATKALLEVLIVGIGMTPLFAAALLPINTPVRGRIFRCAKWIVMTGVVVTAFGPNALKWSWLLVCCFWPLAWTEWMRTSIRRKLPVAKWPRQLYL